MLRSHVASEEMSSLNPAEDTARRYFHTAVLARANPMLPLPSFGSTTDSDMFSLRHKNACTEEEHRK